MLNNNQQAGPSGLFGNISPQPYDEKGTLNYKFNPQQNREGIYVLSITNTQGYRNKCLDELRAEDYAFLKNGQVPDSLKTSIQRNIQGQERGRNNNMGLGNTGSSSAITEASSSSLFSLLRTGLNNNSMGINHSSLFAHSNNVQRSSLFPSSGNSTENYSSSSLSDPKGGGGGSGLFNQGQQGNNLPMDNQQNIPTPPKIEFTLTEEQVKALFPQMLKNQSTATSKFAISSEFGKIEFEGNRDVKERDLDALSDLKQRVDLLLKNDLSAEAAQSQQREKLDKPAAVTLYNCSGERGNNNSEKYKGIAKKMGCEFIDYDEENRILKIKIIHL